MPPPPSKKARIVIDEDAGDDSDFDMEETGIVQDTVQPAEKSRTKKVKIHNTDDASERRTVFVRGLDYATTTEGLSAHFSFVAPLKHATVVVDPATKKSRGFGFVTYTEAEDAQTAVKEFHGKKFEGRQLNVEIAEPRHRDEEGTNGQSDGKRKTEREPGKDEKKRSPRLIVRNLPWSVKKPSQLETIFQKFGKVREVIIPRKDGSKSKSAPMSGFAFVTMRNYKHAEKAIEEINGTEIDGRTVAVDWAVEKNVYQKNAPAEDDADMINEEDEEDESADNGLNGLEEELAEDGEDAASVSDVDSEQAALDEDAEDEDEDDTERLADRPAPKNESTVFIRNLPFTTEDEDLGEHFAEHFGPVRFARVVIDPSTERPRGTGFVAFYNVEDCDACVASANRSTIQHVKTNGKGFKKTSVLQSDELDPTGKYTIEGRVLSVTKAVSREEAGRLTVANTTLREKTQRDKRRLYLLSEGTIPHSHPLFSRLSNTEVGLREASLKQRKSFLEKNPSLHLSLTRLSIRNIPRNITEKDLKQLARKAVVEFASEVKGGKREALSKEEANRGGLEARDEEKRRKAQGKGVVRQAKIVREGHGAGRSKGYGFIEYVGHRWALMGLRWLNGREVANFSFTEDVKDKNDKSAKPKTKPPQESAELQAADRKRRLIVEFALENVQVVARRREMEEKSRDRSRQAPKSAANGDGPEFKSKFDKSKFDKSKDKRQTNGKSFDKKRKRDDDDNKGDGKAKRGTEKVPDNEQAEKMARIIARKRQLKRAKTKGRVPV